MREEFARIVSAIEYTLEQLRRGPKGKQVEETPDNYERRIESWYLCKNKFVLYAIKCLRTIDKGRAEMYLQDLRALGDDI